MGPQLKVVEKARTATMLCAAGGNPDPEISWFKDFLPVDPATSNGRIKQLRSGEPRAGIKGSQRPWTRPLARTPHSFPLGPRCLGLTLQAEQRAGCQWGGLELVAELPGPGKRLGEESFLLALPLPSWDCQAPDWTSSAPPSTRDILSCVAHSANVSVGIHPPLSVALPETQPG